MTFCLDLEALSSSLVINSTSLESLSSIIIYPLIICVSVQSERGNLIPKIVSLPQIKIILVSLPNYKFDQTHSPNPNALLFPKLIPHSKSI